MLTVDRREGAAPQVLLDHCSQDLPRLALVKHAVLVVGRFGRRVVIQVLRGVQEDLDVISIVVVLLVVEGSRPRPQHSDRPRSSSCCH